MLLWPPCRLAYAQSATATRILTQPWSLSSEDEYVTKECHLILWRTNRTHLISFFQPYSYSTVYDTTNEEVCQTIPRKECRDAVKTEYKTVLDRQCVTEKQQQCSTVTEYVTETLCSEGNILMRTQLCVLTKKLFEDKIVNRPK